MQSRLLISPGGGSQCGLYGTFTSTASVVKAAKTNGWPGIAPVSGRGQSTSPYTYALTYGGTTVAEIVGLAYHQGANFWWNDYWTVSGPPSTSNDWTTAGTAAGKYAAGVVMTAANSTGYLPQYVVIDLEGAVQPANEQQFQTMVKGWAMGISQGSSGQLSAAFYSNQSQWTSFNLNSVGLPGFVAISPISTSNPPSATGSNIQGFAAYYATCVNGNATTDVNIVNSWGKNANMVQFTDSGDDCAP